MLGLPHCEHEFPWRGTSASQCRHFFLHVAEVCVWLESRSSVDMATCGHFKDFLSGGMPLHGLTPGNYVLHVTLSFPESQRHANDNSTECPQACNSDSSSIWRLVNLTRTFVIVDKVSSTPAIADSKGNSWNPETTFLPRQSASLDGRQRATPIDSGVGSDESNVHHQQLSECGSYVDDSEWCVYRPACLDAETLGLVLMDLAPDSSDTPFKLGRQDDSTFVPSSLDRSRQSVSNAFNNDLPHRSRALTRHLSAASFADADQRGAVAWFDPSSDKLPGGGYRPGSSYQFGGSPNSRSGRVGLMFVDSPNNVYHAATKALQLSYAAKEPSGRRQKDRGSLLDAVVPLSCTMNGCQPAHASHDNAPAAAWLDGLLALLFPNATTEVIHDPRAWASAMHEKINPGVGGKSPVELLCFGEVVLPGESRALFRGPADARRFRFNARRYLGLSPVVLHPPPKVIVKEQ